MYFTLKEPKSKDKTLIYLRYYVPKDKKYFKVSCGVKINPKNWSVENRLPIAKRGAGGVESRRLTAKLSEINNKLESVLARHGRDITIGKLKQEFKKEDTPEYARDYFLLCIKEKHKIGSILKPSLKKYNTVLKKFIDFERYSKKQFKLEDLTQSFFIDFIVYLREIDNLYDNTLSRYLSVLKTFILWCNKKGFNTPQDYKDVVVKKHETDDVALNKKEIELLENAVLTGAKDRARDLFLIGIYSGQRWSDYSVFDKADVRDGLIIKRAKKTETFSYIPLTNKLESILNKYNWRLPKISSQKFNVHIQKICKDLEINHSIKNTSFQGKRKDVIIKEKWEMIGSHTARRTFITLAAENNVPDHIIMAITGIRNPNTLKKYKKVNKNSIIDLTKDLF